MIVRAITKSKKKVMDCYCVYFWDNSCLTLSSNPDSPQGVSQWSEYFGINHSHFEEATESNDRIIPKTHEKMINFYDIPSIVQSHIEKRIRNS